jgi:LacI family transcriptional regulator
MATIRDVARMAGVSTSTVSHVINQTRFVSEDTRQRVYAAMEELHYTPNNIAQSLRRQRTNTIGVLMPTTANPYFGGMLAAIESASFEHGHNLVIGNANNDPDREHAYLDVLISRQIDGMLLISTGDILRSVERLQERKVPVVVVDRPTRNQAVDEVLTDNRQGGYLATQHLLAQGHQHIACIAGPEHLVNSRERQQGYFDALAGAGITVDAGRVRAGEFDHASGYDVAYAILNDHPDTTAIFACNDLMAIGAMRAAHDFGLAVPSDLSVIGFDDISMAAYTNPKLTTIAQPTASVGRVAIERLLQRIESADRPAQSDVLPVTLVERESCAPVRNH